MLTSVYQTCLDVTLIIKLYVPAHPSNVLLVLNDLAAMSLSNISFVIFFLIPFRKKTDNHKQN